jgi:hypothetical protein
MWLIAREFNHEGTKGTKGLLYNDESSGLTEPDSINPDDSLLYPYDAGKYNDGSSGLTESDALEPGNSLLYCSASF